jgi:Trypsin-like serine proteases, typically periplasmic, contain C-terminal PDZ domain
MRTQERRKKEARILARSAGTAFAVNEQGYLITSHHIIQNADDIAIFSSEGSMGWRGKIVKVNKKLDLALIKIDTVTKANSIATWNTVPNGLEIFAFGFPNPSIQGRELKNHIGACKLT